MNNSDYGVSGWIRLIHFFLDFLIYTIISIIIYVLVKLINPLLINLNWSLLFTIIYILYYFLFESLLLKTPAKFLTDSTVYDLKKNCKPRLSQILIRSLIRVIPFDGIFILFLKNNLCLHDILSRTAVIQNRSVST